MMRCAPGAGARNRIHECVASARSGPRRAPPQLGIRWGRLPRGLARGFGLIYAVGAVPARFLVAERIGSAPCARRRAA